MMVNRHAGPCADCRVHVPAGQGALMRRGGKWRVGCAKHSGRDYDVDDLMNQSRDDYDAMDDAPIYGFDSE